MNLGRIWNFTSDNCAPRKAEHLHPSSFSIWMRKRSFKNFTTKKKKELHYNLLLLLLSRFSRQPTRLHRPWDSPGNNTEVGCHFLLQCMKVNSESEFAQSCPTLSDPVDCSLPGSSVHGIFQARVREWAAIAFSDDLLSLKK